MKTIVAAIFISASSLACAGGIGGIGGPGAPITRIIDFTKDGIPVRASQLERLDKEWCVSRHPVTYGVVVRCPTDPDIYIPWSKTERSK